MNAYFTTPERLQALATEAARWPGTPFVSYGAFPGPRGGASCHCLCGAVLAGAGWTVGEVLPRYKVNHAQHHAEGVMLPWLRARPEKFAEIAPASIELLLPGDLAISPLDGLCDHHMGVAIPGGRVLHTLRRRGAHTIERSDPALRAYLTAIFRPLAWEGMPA